MSTDVGSDVTDVASYETSGRTSRLTPVLLRFLYGVCMGFYIHKREVVVPVEFTIWVKSLL